MDRSSLVVCTPAQNRFMNDDVDCVVYIGLQSETQTNKDAFSFHPVPSDSCFIFTSH